MPRPPTACYRPSAHSHIRLARRRTHTHITRGSTACPAHKSMLQIKYFRTFFIPINISERLKRAHTHTHTPLLIILIPFHWNFTPFFVLFFFPCRIDTSHAMATTLSPLWIPHRIICWCWAMRMPRTRFYAFDASWTHAMPAMTSP